jgi:hypothetical protein
VRAGASTVVMWDRCVRLKVLSHVARQRFMRAGLYQTKEGLLVFLGSLLGGNLNSDAGVAIMSDDLPLRLRVISCFGTS